MQENKINLLFSPKSKSLLNVYIISMFKKVLFSKQVKQIQNQ